LDSKHIGRISIFDAYSTVDLPKDMPNEVFNGLKKVWVGGQALQISKFDPNAEGSASVAKRPRLNKPDQDGDSDKPNKPKYKSKSKDKAKDSDKPKKKSYTKKKPAAKPD